MKQLRKQMRMLALSLLLFSSAHSISFAYNDALLPQIIAGEPGVNAGDIILPLTIDEVGAWCDFTKTIVFTNRGFLCVFNGKPVPGISP